MNARRPGMVHRCSMRSHPPTLRASALLLVLWALILLSGAVLAYAKWIQADIALHGYTNREIEARAMAHSGLAVALHELVTERTEGLDEDLASDLGYRIRMISEGGKLNIRFLIEGEQPERLEILKLWLERHGLDYRQREAFVDSLLDWVDGDDVKHLNGVEDEGDYHPPNRPMEDLDEIELVANSGPLARSPGWKDEITMLSQGPIDLTAAGPDVLRLLGLGEANIARFLVIRRGRDGVDGTPDDYQFKNLKEIQSFLGMSDAQFKRFNGLVTHKDQTLRIIAEGRSGNATRQVEVVARKGGANPQILLWKE
jgi:general secretion pathway protein K